LRTLAKFGDSLVNFAFSIALSLITNSPRGVKVPDKLLADIARRMGLREYFHLHRLREGELADLVEALLAMAWVQGLIDLGTLSVSLTKGLSVHDRKSRMEMEKAMADNLAELVGKLMKEVKWEKCMEDFVFGLRKRLESSL